MSSGHYFDFSLSYFSAMEHEQVSTEQTTSQKQQRRNWTQYEESTLINILEGMVAEGFKGENGTFKVGAHEEVCKRMESAIPGIKLTTKHVINKMKRWHQKFVQVTDMTNTSGFGWDDTRKCVIVDSDQVLQEYMQKHPKVSNHVNKEFKEFDQLQTIFGRDRATGHGAEGVPESIAHMNAGTSEVGAGEGDEEVIGANSPMSVGNDNVADATTSESGKPRKKSKNIEIANFFMETIKESMVTVSANIEAATEKLVSGKFDSIGAIEALGLTPREEINLIREFGSNSKMEERFMRLPAEKRYDWVKELLRQ